jgi:cytochrome oxidase Cu insertion factor (SCO1/SenC/PrrC family)
VPGMNSGLDANNPTIVAAFRNALLHQGILILFFFAVLAFAWIAIREGTPRLAAARAAARSAARAEPAWRRVLRIGFGIIWIFDGLLQAQPDMAVGLPSQGIEPGAASSPGWVQHIVNWGATSWSYHPVQTGAAAVWIQAGIGVWLLATPRGRWSRVAGLASVAWGLVVWVFGESFGGIFAPGLSWLSGAPGAVLFYCTAGVLIALPERYWRAPQVGRGVLAVMGAFFAGMAVLQAWPGRGFWQGTLHGSLGSMISSMASVSQPSVLAGWVASFASLAAAHAVAVNLFAVIALAVLGTGLLSGAMGWTGPAATAAGNTGAGDAVRAWLLRATVIAVVVLCLADWVLVQDFGFFGGVGTDPNSMIPMALVVVAGYLALAPAPEPAAPPASPAAGNWLGRVRPAQLIRAFGAASTRVVLATWAVAIIIVGAAPMAAAQTSRTADPIIAQAINGNSAALDYPAAPFQLTDQYGRPVSLASLHGKVVLLTFLDPVCTSDCPVIAQEFAQANQILGTQSGRVELVAIVANPLYRSVAYVQAFDSEERLTGLPNWLFLTGSLARLQQAWKDYAISAQVLPAGGMIGHSNAAYLIDAGGRVRTEFNMDPGPATSSSESSFAAELASAARQSLRSS